MQQRQQLKKVHDDLHASDQNLNTTADVLKRMSGWGSAFVGMFRSRPVKEKAPDIREIVNDPEEKENPNSTTIPDTSYARRQRADLDRDRAQRDRNQGQRTQIQASAAQTQEEVHQNEKLDDLLKGIKTLGGMAENINEELDLQSKMLNKIDNKMEDVNHKIDCQNNTMRRRWGV